MYPSVCDDGDAGDSSSSWHGSHVAGIAAATTNNALGVAGVAWNVRILPVRALGKCGGSLSDIAEAIRWAAGLQVDGVPTNPTPAQVINLSLGGGDTCGPTMQSAVTAAMATGAVVVAATGNEATNGLISPANCTGVIGVTAHTINGENADYANIGSGVTISAPGGGSPSVLGAGGETDDPNWWGFRIWSTVLFGNTDSSEHKRSILRACLRRLHWHKCSIASCRGCGGSGQVAASELFGVRCSIISHYKRSAVPGQQRVRNRGCLRWPMRRRIARRRSRSDNQKCSARYLCNYGSSSELLRGRSGSGAFGISMAARRSTDCRCY